LILVVDDEPALRDAVAGLLADAGYRVAVAWNGADALARWERDPPELVLSDVMMPGLDGLGLVRALRARGDATPVILTSAAGAPIGGPAGVAWLPKPVDPDALLRLVAEQLRA
jgi:two-component system response regulator MprA